MGKSRKTKSWPVLFTVTSSNNTKLNTLLSMIFDLSVNPLERVSVSGVLVPLGTVKLTAALEAVIDIGT